MAQTGSYAIANRSGTPAAEAHRRTCRAPPAGTSVAFLAPLDPLVWDRELLRTLFDHVLSLLGVG